MQNGFMGCEQVKLEKVLDDTHWNHVDCDRGRVETVTDNTQ